MFDFDHAYFNALKFLKTYLAYLPNDDKEVQQAGTFNFAPSH